MLDDDLRWVGAVEQQRLLAAGDDELLLGLALEMQAAADWRRRRPPIR